MKFTPLAFLLILAFAVPLRAQDAMVWLASGKPDDFSWPPCITAVRQIPGTPVFRVQYPGDGDCEALLLQTDGILYVEENNDIMIPEALAAAGDDFHTCTTLADIDELVNLSTGKAVVAAVIDTGLSFSVYGASAVPNTGEIPGDGIDNDQNGYIDDYDGWDFGDMDPDPTDEHGHGTQVSSVLLGIAPDAQILPIKVNSGLNVSFSTGDAAEAIYYAVARGADILNLSFSTSSYSVAIASAVIFARNSGCLVIAAAGNDGLSVQFPASMDETVAVGAYDASGLPTYFSPSGDAMDILAPGEAICVTDVDGTGVTASGTSFSAPAVTGTAAVLLAMNRNLSASTLETILYSGTADILDDGWDTTSGYGNLDSKTLVDVSTPSVEVPEQVAKGDLISIGLNLPPTDTDTNVYFGVVFNAVTWWMDSAGNWYNAENTPLQPYAGLTLNDFFFQEIFGPGGIYGSVDTGIHLAGTYLWGTAIFDKKGNLLAPVGWTEMTLN